jgi:hypothetical protein
VQTAATKHPVDAVKFAELEDSLAKRGAAGESGFEVLAERLARKAANRNEKPTSQAKARQSKQVIDPAEAWRSRLPIPTSGEHSSIPGCNSAL